MSRKGSEGEVESTIEVQGPCKSLRILSALIGAPGLKGHCSLVPTALLQASLGASVHVRGQAWHGGDQEPICPHKQQGAGSQSLRAPGPPKFPVLAA